jgi:hypothetical protein
MQAPRVPIGALPIGDAAVAALYVTKIPEQRCYAVGDLMRGKRSYGWLLGIGEPAM